MPKTKLQKEQDLQELTDRLKSAKSVVMSEYRGTTVKDIDAFRRALTKENVQSKVYKITLLKKALAANGIAADGVDFKTPVIISTSDEEETTAARMVKQLSGTIPTIQILSGLVDNQIIGKEMVLALAGLPSKDQLRAQLVGTINAPVSGFVNVLAGNLRGLINVLNAVAQKN
jgi:large subunit ribosomal protein L10